MKKVMVIGAGLAGSEAAWQAANAGATVTLCEMRPHKLTPAHKTGRFAELVCSNSLRAAGLANAAGILKEEMRRLNSLIMAAADATAVPAGGALAVDREQFAALVTKKLLAHPNIKFVPGEVTEIPTDGDSVTVIATGPLTEGAMAEAITELTGQAGLYFYDAAAPIVSKESLDMDKLYFASRYGKGEASYLNAPMTQAEYEDFWQALVTAETADVHDFEPTKIFEGCMPVEVMAARGKETLLFGPLKPVGLEHPATGERPYAVVQLRQDNAAGTLYNLVGFQTHLKWPEQRRVFGKIPGLANAEFVRYGVMHRNTFICSPRLLKPTMQLKARDNVFFAGQMTGVEGYIESAAAGLVAGVNAARLASGRTPLIFPPETCHGALTAYITSADADNFQPMNISFGLLPPPTEKIRSKKVRRERQAERALAAIDDAKLCLIGYSVPKPLPGEMISPEPPQ